MTGSADTKVGLKGLSTLLLLAALVLVAGGGWLTALGGSPYYLPAGIVLGASAILLRWGDGRGLWLYASLWLATLAWSIFEAGFHGWLLLPRLMVPTLLGAWLCLPWARRRLGLNAAPSIRPTMLMLGLTMAALGCGSALRGWAPAQERDPVFQAGITGAPEPRPDMSRSPSPDWKHYGNDLAGTRFSPADQITPANVSRVELAWSTRLGDRPGSDKGGLEVTPLKVGDLLYACNSLNDVFAIDAETGEQRWHFTSGIQSANVCRGVAYHEVPGATGLCARRIISNTAAAKLIALDAMTGERCTAFGKDGEVDLLTGIGKAPIGYYKVTSAPTVVRGRIVLGGWVTDNQYWGEPSGVIRAFDAVTGQLSWAFDMGRPDRHELPQEPDTYTLATPNSWAPMSGDEALGMVYVPTGNATPDFFGGNRRSFDDRYSSSVLALDAETGALRWSFQTAHHDVWDYDVASQPTLVDLPDETGGITRALIQATKRGELFLLDRTTGAPLSAVVEKPVPVNGKVPEERLSATQPFSDGLPSLRGPQLREVDMWGLTPLDQLACRIMFRNARYEGPMTPPGTSSSISYPGFLGGVDWGSVAIDVDRSLMIVNSNRFAVWTRLIPRQFAEKIGMKAAGDNAKKREAIGLVAQERTPYAALSIPFMSPLMLPCQAPPHGFLSAIDLNTRKLVWTRPIGTARDSGPLTLSSLMPIPVGTLNIGGAVTTRGGVTWIGATEDHYLRAFETATGRLLWQARLPAGAQATPTVYRSERSGRQFIVVAAGGHDAFFAARGNYLLAYALPRDAAP